MIARDEVLFFLHQSGCYKSQLAFKREHLTDFADAIFLKYKTPEEESLQGFCITTSTA